MTIIDIHCITVVKVLHKSVMKICVMNITYGIFS